MGDNSDDDLICTSDGPLPDFPTDAEIDEKTQRFVRDAIEEGRSPKDLALKDVIRVL